MKSQRTGAVFVHFKVMFKWVGREKWEAGKEKEKRKTKN